MTDITKCKGEDCPQKDKCYRFTAPESEMQSYFAESPFNGKRCDYFLNTEPKYYFFSDNTLFHSKYYKGDKVAFTCPFCGKEFNLAGKRYAIAKLFENKALCTECFLKYPNKDEVRCL